MQACSASSQKASRRRTCFRQWTAYCARNLSSYWNRRLPEFGPRFSILVTNLITLGNGPGVGGTSLGAKKKGRAEALPCELEKFPTLWAGRVPKTSQRLGSFELLGFLQFLSHVL